jgi:DNA-binding CsgD family transcriptional regulator
MDGVGKLIIGALAGLAVWRGMGESGRQKGLGFLDELAKAQQRYQEEQERQRRLAALQEAVRAALSHPPPLISLAGVGILSPKPVLNAPMSPASAPVIQEPDARWRSIIVHPSVVLVLGKRGSGKSALGYRLLELFRYVATPHVVGVPRSARSLLPDWIGIAPSLEDVPPKATALVDEAYLAYHARGSMAAEARAMSQLLNLSRQREQTLVFVSQEARQVDRNIASSANVVVFKDLGMLQLEFDRPEMNKLAGQAKEAFSTVQGDRRRWAFVYAPDADHVGMLENEVPTFWKPSLSHLFAVDAPAARPRAAHKTTPQEKAQKAREMRAKGASYQDIATALGVTRGTALNYVRGYPYRRRGA